MDNRGEFLNNVAQALGRPLRFEPQAEDAPLNNYANERLTELNQQQRCDAFIQFASDVMLTRCVPRLPFASSKSSLMSR